MARNQLLIEGIVLGGCSVSLSDKNPFILRGAENTEIPATKLFVSDIPISVDNKDIESALLRIGCVFRSSLFMERIRNKDGKLTRFVTGRRFVFISLPEKPLDRSLKVGGFSAQLYYKEQPKAYRSPVCTNCLQPGHWQWNCQNLVTCKACLQSGHKQGDPVCGLVLDPSQALSLPDGVVDGERSGDLDPVGQETEKEEQQVDLQEEEEDDTFMDTVDGFVPETQLSPSSSGEASTNKDEDRDLSTPSSKGKGEIKTYSAKPQRSERSKRQRSEEDSPTAITAKEKGSKTDETIWEPFCAGSEFDEEKEGEG